MEGVDFLQLLQNCDCLIGNSSVGIRECAFLGVPVVNIGSRQNRRERGGNSVDVDYLQDQIQEAILNSIQKGKLVSSSIYGNGNAGNQIANLLAELPLQFHKTIMY
jgi:UDP-N-acetylglucosamine 2-epimerase